MQTPSPYPRRHTGTPHTSPGPLDDPGRRHIAAPPLPDTARRRAPARSRRGTGSRAPARSRGRVDQGPPLAAGLARERAPTARLRRLPSSTQRRKPPVARTAASAAFGGHPARPASAQAPRAAGDVYSPRGQQSRGALRQTSRSRALFRIRKSRTGGGACFHRFGSGPRRLGSGNRSRRGPGRSAGC